MARSFALALAALVIGAATARGTSTPPVLLTSKNLGDQPHRLTIGATAHEDDVQFRVRVASKDTKAPPPEVDGGYLTVYDGDRLVCACPTGFVRDVAAVLSVAEQGAVIASTTSNPSTSGSTGVDPVRRRFGIEDDIMPSSR